MLRACAEAQGATEESVDTIPKLGLRELDLSMNVMSKDMATSLAAALKTFTGGLQVRGYFPLP